MTAPPSTLHHQHRPLPAPTASSRREATEEFGRYRFQVVAGNIADAVTSIGGLIYDRAMAGWDVSVVVDGDQPVDDRPVRILGARVTSRWSDHFRVVPRPNLLAVATDMMIKSDGVRRRVLEIDDETEVLLWGRHRPTNLGRTFVAVRHQPGAAARAFKSHAVTAVGAQAISRVDESFYSRS